MTKPEYEIEYPFVKGASDRKIQLMDIHTVHDDGLSWLGEVDSVSGGDCLLGDSHG
jgi:hypothetical protein